MNSKKLILIVAAFAFACTDHGKKHKFGELDLYVKPGISEKQIKKSGEVLEALQYTKQAVSVQLEKVGETYHVRFIVDPAKVEKKAIKTAFSAVKAMFEIKPFRKKKVKLDLCDGTFTRVIKTI